MGKPPPRLCTTVLWFFVSEENRKYKYFPGAKDIDIEDGRAGTWKWKGATDVYPCVCLSIEMRYSHKMRQCALNTSILILILTTAILKRLSCGLGLGWV